MYNKGGFRVCLRILRDCTGRLTNLAEIELKNNILKLNKKFHKPERGTTVETTFAHSYSILFMKN